MTPTTDLSRPRPARRGGRLRRLAVLGGPATRPISGRRHFPLYGVLHHVGRKSGHEYATPVVVRSTPDSVYVPLPFGEGTDWYRNAVAAGGVRATWKGRDHWLANPCVVERQSAGPAFSGVMHGLMRLAGISHVVRFDPIAERDRG